MVVRIQLIVQVVGYSECVIEIDMKKFPLGVKIENKISSHSMIRIYFFLYIYGFNLLRTGFFLSLSLVFNKNDSYMYSNLLV